MDHETPTPLSQIIPGNRISVSAAHCLSPSMANMAKRCVPVVCQVAFIQKEPGGWLVEGVDGKLFRFDGNPMVKRLIPVVSALDDLKPAGVGVGERFKNVSIE